MTVYKKIIQLVFSAILTLNLNVSDATEKRKLFDDFKEADNKKIKLADHISTLTPLLLVEIMSYLSQTERLKAREVSQIFYSRINKYCLNKVEIPEFMSKKSIISLREFLENYQIGTLFTYNTGADGNGIGLIREIKLLPCTFDNRKIVGIHPWIFYSIATYCGGKLLKLTGLRGNFSLLFPKSGKSFDELFPILENIDINNDNSILYWKQNNLPKGGVGGTFCLLEALPKTISTVKYTESSTDSISCYKEKPVLVELFKKCKNIISLDLKLRDTDGYVNNEVSYDNQDNQVLKSISENSLRRCALLGKYGDTRLFSLQDLEILSEKFFHHITDGYLKIADFNASSAIKMSNSFDNTSISKIYIKNFTIIDMKDITLKLFKNFRNLKKLTIECLGLINGDILTLKVYFNRIEEFKIKYIPRDIPQTIDIYNSSYSDIKISVPQNINCNSYTSK